MSSVTLAQVGCLLRAPWQWRRNSGQLWALGLYGLLMVLLLGLPAVAALVWLPRGQAWVAAGGLAGLAMVLVWVAQWGALLRLDHPQAAHTVPGHTAALRATALGLALAWVLLAAGAAALAAALLGERAGVIGPVVGLAMGTTLLFTALLARWWWVGLALGLLTGLAGQAFWRAPAWAWAQPLWQAQPVAVTAVVLLLQGLMLSRLFGAGDARHARAHAQRERMRRLMTEGTAGLKPPLARRGPWAERLGGPLQRLADAWLARQCRRATAQPASVMARAELVLFGPQHWVTQAASLLLVQALLAAGLGLAFGLNLVDPQTLFGHLSFQLGITIGLTSMALGAALGVRGALWQSRREQALLVLLPGMPQGVAQGQALARAQWRHGLVLWLALLPGLLLLTWFAQWFGQWLGQGFGQGFGVWAFVALVPPISAWAWPDVARLRPPGPLAVTVPMLLCLIGGWASQALLSRYPAAVWPWAIGLLLLTLGLLAWRWRHLPHLPQALPAGRLA